MEVTRQCSNLSPPLQRVVSSHQLIRRRPTPAVISQEPAKRLPSPTPRLTDEMLNEAERRNGAGDTLRRVASDSGVSRQRLAVCLGMRGVEIRGQGPSRKQVLEMSRRYAQRESLATVDAWIGCNAGTVRTYLLRAGVALRDAHGRAR